MARKHLCTGLAPEVARRQSVLSRTASTYVGLIVYKPLFCVARNDGRISPNVSHPSRKPQLRDLVSIH